MTDSPSFKPVFALTLAFCAVMAIGAFLVPEVRDGTLPPVGGLIWHALALPYLLLTRVFAPVIARLGGAQSPIVQGVGMIVASVATSVLLAMAVWHTLEALRTRRQDATGK